MQCPNEAELGSFVMGELPPERNSIVADHCDECLDCQALLETVVVHADTVLDAIRQGIPDVPYINEPACASLMDFTLQESEQTGGLGSPAPRMNDKLGQYQIIQPLGKGGMGTVYKARHLKLKRTVALKLLAANRLRKENIARFAREMESVGQLNHPNIVVAHDAGEAEGHHYLAMELLSGVDLSKLSRANGPLAVSSACELIRQAAIGLHHAHENGIVHRDVKPSNLMLTNEGTVKVLDLGLARMQSGAIESEEPELTTTGQIMGTITYISPEQCHDSAKVGASADIYGLGASLYKLLSGVTPYSGDNFSTPMQQLAALATMDPPSIRMHRADLPKELIALVDSMVRREISKRPATAADVAKRLASFSDADSLVGLLAESEASRSNIAPELTPTSVQPAHSPTNVFKGNGNPWLKITAMCGIAAAMMFALFQITVTTKSGTIFIDTGGEKKTPVTITDETVTFRDPTDGAIVTVKVDHENNYLEFTKPGFRSTGKNFEIESANGQKISIRFEPKKVLEKVASVTPAEMKRSIPELAPPKPVTPSTKAASSAALAMIKLLEDAGCGGRMTGQGLNVFFEPRDPNEPIKKGSRVSRKELASVVARTGREAGVKISHLSVTSDADLKEFADYAQQSGTKITTLRLFGKESSDDSVPVVARISPSQLILNGSSLTAAGIARLLKENQLRALSFNQHALTTEAMAPLKDQKTLNALRFFRSYGIDGWDMRELTGLPLEELQLLHLKIANKAFDSISEISTLSTLHLAGVVRKHSDKDRIITAVTKLEKLTELAAYSQYFNASDLAPLSSLRSLSTLTCQVKPDTLDVFERFQSLRYLFIDINGEVDGKNVTELRIPKNLKNLLLSDATPEQLQSLKVMQPTCRIVVDPERGAGLREVPNAENARTLTDSVKPSREATARKMLELVKNAGGYGEITPQGLELVFSPSHKADAAEIARIGESARVRIHTLRFGSAASDLKAFADYPDRTGTKIEALHLYGMHFTNERVPLIKQVSPSGLGLNKTAIQDSGVKSLLESKQWNTLSINGPNLSLETVARLKDQKELSELEFRNVSGIEDWDMGELTTLPLNKLVTLRTAVSDKAIDSICKISTLERLSFSGLVRDPKDTVKVISKIGELPRLRSVTAASRHFKASDMLPLAKMDTLAALTCQVKPDSLDGFENFKSLHTLEFNFNVTPDHVIDLQSLRTLKKLTNLRLSQATDEQTKQLKAWLPTCNVRVAPYADVSLHDKP